MKKYLLSIILIFSAIGTTAQVKVDAFIDSIAILIGEQAHVTLSVTAKNSDRIEFQPLKEAHYVVPGLELLHVEKADTIQLEDNLIKVSKRLTLTSFDEKLYPIPSFWIKVNGKKYTTNSLALKVITVDVDTLHLNQFYPPKDVQDNPFSWNDWKEMFWCSVLLVLLLVVSIYLWVRLKQNKPIIVRVKVVKHLPPHKKALIKIEQIKQDKLTVSSNQKEYYTKLTDTLRRYIEERFGFNAMEMTTSEIIEHLQKEGDNQMLLELKELFETADLVKFAKYSAQINENDLNLVNAIHFIDNTKMSDMPIEERIIPKLTENDERSKKQRTAMQVGLVGSIIVVVVLFVYIVNSLLQLLF